MLNYLASFFVVRRLSPTDEKRGLAPVLESHEQDQADPLINEETGGERTGYRTKGPSLWNISARLLVISPAAILAFIILSLTTGSLFTAAFIPWQTRDSSLEGVAPNVQSTVATITPAPCGNSPEEARRNGCYFDVISFCWLPTECYDAELAHSFDDSQTWEWFLDSNRTMSLSHEQIMTGEYTGLYVTWEYHLRHCTAMWKKMHRALLSDKGRSAIDGYIGGYGHTEHCEGILLLGRAIESHTINTQILVKYPACGI